MPSATTTMIAGPFLSSRTSALRGTSVAGPVDVLRPTRYAWLDCAPMRSDGSLGDERRMTARTGSPGGRPVSDAHCRDGRALQGLTGRTGASIDETVGECAFVREIAERGDNPHAEMTESVTRPRPAGRPSEARCPAGFVVTGFRSTSGEYMDHLWIVCSELQRSY